MPRSLWTGSLSFGLVNVPVRLETAVRDRDLHFRQIHRKDGAPIEVQRWCSKEDVEVDYEEITHGYELDEGGQVTVSDLELQAVEPRRTRTIDIEQFVELAEVDPLYFDHPYWLVPASDDDGAVRAYRLLHDAMARAERVGLGRWVFHNREYLAAVRPLDDVLALHTMRFADELVDAGSLDLPSPSRKPSAREVKMAGALVDSLGAAFDPSQFEDSYRERVLNLIQAKARGEEPELPEAPEPAGDTDLMAALEASLQGS